MSDIWRDLRHAFRGLRRSPAFTAVAVMSIALGIGANAAIFTLLDQVLLRRLPVKHPEELVLLTSSRENHYGNNQGGNALSFPMYEDFRDALVQRTAGEPAARATAQLAGREVLQPVFAGLFCRFAVAFNVTFGGQTERANGELVSGTYFPVLGVGPAIGRLIAPDDDRTPGAEPVAVLSYDYWQRRFGGDRTIVGQTIRVNDHVLTVIGVSERGFFGVDAGFAPDIRVPMMMKAAMTPGWDALSDRRSRWINVFGRLAPNVTRDHAAPALQTAFQRVIDLEVNEPAFRNASADTRSAFLRMTTDLLPGSQGRAPLRKQLEQPLSLLMAIVAGVLLIACANVAGLLVARTAGRQREIAVRVSLGARRWQVIRPLIVESLLLATVGGAAGLALSFWTSRFLLAFLLPPNTPHVISAMPDARIVAFTFALSLASGLLFGIVPALGGTRDARVGLLRDRTVTGGAGIRLRKALVVAQVALSLLLLAGAGLFIRSLQHLRSIDLGIRTENLVAFRASPGLSGLTPARIRQFYRDVVDGMRARPGVTAVGFAAMGLLEGNEWDATITIDGHTPTPGEDRNPFCNAVSPGYFKTMGMALRMGRDIADADVWRPGDAIPPGSNGGYRVAIANDSFVKRFFGTENPIGKHIGFGADPGTQTPIEIVGVVADAKYTGVRDDIPRQLFMPYFQNENAGGVIVYVRTLAKSDSIFATIREVVRGVDPNVPVYSLRTVEDKADQSLVRERLIATLSGAFGVVATLLAIIGVYGLMAYTVTQRTKEIGIRMALGALSKQVVWLVTREAALLVTLGLVIGLVAALGLSRFVANLLYGLTPRDPLSLGLAVAILGLVGVLAGLVPARRASRVDPARALRDE